MSGKKYLLLLGILAAASFGVSLTLSALLGGSRPSAKPAKTAAKPLSKSEALLAGLAAAHGPAVPMSPSRDKLEELVKDLRARVAEYERKERKLAERENRLALAERNLDIRAKELEKLRMQLVGPLTRLKDAVAELKRSQVVVSQQEKANLRRIADTFSRMDATKGGKILSGMCENNQIDDVVKILYYMDERAAGKLLAEMADQGLAAKLTGLMQKVREQG
ncbi:MAG: hypothetical protein J7M21_00265 [Planctomycetes bacterium]|nr:hypothetical protein [Planctomycetota bacterium]